MRHGRRLSSLTKRVILGTVAIGIVFLATADAAGAVGARVAGVE